MSLSSGWSLDLCVNPIIDSSKILQYSSILLLLSRSGSTETNNASRSKYLYSLLYLTFYKAFAIFIKETGQTSGQKVNPKYIR